MRKSIFEYLTENSSIKSWHQPFTATQSTKKPYGVIKMGEEVRDVLNRNGLFRTFSIWVYFNKGSFIPVDEACEEIKHLLSNQILTTENNLNFEVEYEFETQDYYDPELDSNTRRIEFRIPRVRK